MEIQEEKLNNVSEQVFESASFLRSKFFLPALTLVVLLGVASGYFLSLRGKTNGTIQPGGMVSSEKIKAGGEFGATLQEFKDTTLGILEKGGIDGEGTHKLLREGGSSQTAYLTSSVLDLDQFVGRKVQIWGETFRGQKAGWLMDVGRLKILE